MLRLTLPTALLLTGLILTSTARADELRAYINAPYPTAAAARMAMVQETEIAEPVDLTTAAHAHDQQPLLLTGSVASIAGQHRFVMTDASGQRLMVKVKGSTNLLRQQDAVLVSGHLRKHLFGRTLEADDVQRTASAKVAAST